MHQESAYSFLPFSAAQSEQTLRWHIDHEKALAHIICQGDNIIAFQLASLSDYIFSSATLASSLVIYVQQSARGSRAAILLMRAFIDWAMLHKADELYVGVSVDIKLDKADKFFKHLGFKYVGGNYKLRLQQ